MALATPVALLVNSFDADNSQDFSFNCTGGNQIVANRITIVNTTTNDIVYQNKITTYSYSQTVPANTLTNGVRYYFYFNTYDVYDNISADSNKIYFYCYSASTITFTNLPSSGTINSASYTFTATWSQAQDETLSSFQFFLYDNTRTVIDQSEKLTSTNTPPITFSHTFDGFDDDTVYYVSAKAISSNGIEVSTELYSININNDFSGDYFLIKATNHCSEGYNEIVNNVHEIDGITDGTFIDDEHLLLNEWGQTVYWSSGLQFFNDSFVFLLWWRPILLGKIVRIQSEDGNTWFDFTFKRNIPTSGDVIAKDYILVEGYYNGHQYVSQKSNLITQINNNTDVFLYVQVVGNDVVAKFSRADATGTILEWNTHYYAWNKFSDSIDYYTLSETPSVNDIIYAMSNNSFTEYGTVSSYDATDDEIIDTNNSNYARNSNADNSQDGESDVIYGVVTGIVWDDEPSSIDINYLIWNGGSNVEYNRITDMWWLNESQGSIITDADWKYNDYNTTYMTNVELRNMIVDAIYITHNTSYPYSSVKPTWDNATVMYCEFQNNTLAGNVDWVTSNITKVKLKRRLQGTQRWLTLYEKPINTVEDLTIEYTDYLCPSGYTFEYALVPCTNDAEWDYSITTVDTYYDGLFLIDSDMNCKKLYGGVLYNSDVTVNSIGTLQPYNSQYPVIIRNLATNYKQTNISGYLVNDEDYSDVMSISARTNMTLMQKDWSEYLATGKSIIIKDWNGRILLVQITVAPSYTYTQLTANALPYITFTTSEIGQYNNASDLYKQGFLAIEA